MIRPRAGKDPGGTVVLVALALAIPFGVALTVFGIVWLFTMIAAVPR